MWKVRNTTLGDTICFAERVGNVEAMGGSTTVRILMLDHFQRRPPDSISALLGSGIGKLSSACLALYHKRSGG